MIFEGANMLKPAGVFWSRAFVAALCCLFFFSLPVQAAQGAEWPRSIKADGILAVLYQPSVESWDNGLIRLKFPLAATFVQDKAPVFGALYLDAASLVNEAEGLVYLKDLNSFRSDFPAAPEREAVFDAAMREHAWPSVQTMSLGLLRASTAAGAGPSDQQPPWFVETPEIIFSEKPALMIYIDGEPRFSKPPSSDLEKVVNTNVLLLRYNARYYLHFLDGYLTADSLAGPWDIAKSTPPDAAELERIAEQSGSTDLLRGNPDQKGVPSSLKALKGKAPEVYVTYSPKGLVVTDGPPVFVPLKGTKLLYAKNAWGDLFREPASGHYYTLLSGVWFSAANLNGPWDYVRPEALPKDFANIPDSSDKKYLKNFLPGADGNVQSGGQEEDARVSGPDAREARVDRQTATYQADLPGAPELRPIKGTSLYYVNNAPDPIIQVSPSSWMALRQGVWYESPALVGPWAVATYVPAPIYAIPASSPLYYVTYVRVAQVTPRYVFFNYAPGYSGVILAGGPAYYRSWAGGPYYAYPAYPSAGIGFGYSNWGGAGFGLSFGWGFGPSRWWGPPPYWGSYRPYHHHYRYAPYPPPRPHYGPPPGPRPGTGHRPGFNPPPGFRPEPGYYPGGRPDHRPGPRPDLGPGQRPDRRPDIGPGPRPDQRPRPDGMRPDRRPDSRPDGVQPSPRPGPRPDGIPPGPRPDAVQPGPRPDRRPDQGVRPAPQPGQRPDAGMRPTPPQDGAGREFRQPGGGDAPGRGDPGGIRQKRGNEGGGYSGGRGEGRSGGERRSGGGRGGSGGSQ